MDRDTRVRLSVEVFAAMARLVHRTAQEAAAVLAADGLNPAQFRLLLAVRDEPGEVQHRLVSRGGTTPGNVSMLVTKLEAAGLLRREADGAANRLWLTPTGDDLVGRLAPAQDAFMLDRFGHLGDDQIRELHRLTVLDDDALPS